VRTLAIRILIVAVIAVGGFIFRDRLTGGAGDLKAGDCFDDKAGTEIKDVQHHPCSEAHTAEVVLVTKHGAAKGAALPSDAELDAWAAATCVPRIVSYVGAGADFDTLNYGIFYPRADDWSKGERQMICYVIRIDAAPMSKSLKAGAS
jgi:putative regulator of septum formation